MKKLSLMIIFAVLCLAIFAGCKNNQNPPDGSHKHSFGEWKTVKQASCTEEGQKERTCACGEKETVTVPMTTHNFVNGVCDKCGAKPSEGLEYTLNSDGKSYSVSGIGTCTDKDIIIPDTYENLPVTQIDDYAFILCTELTSITIPNSVISIGSLAMGRCTGLTRIIIPDSVTNIGSNAFNSCAGLTSIMIPNSVTNIGDFVFSKCPELTSINVDSKNTQYHSVNNCLIETASKTLIAGCKNSVIPDDGSVTSISDGTFSGCTGLTNITIPDSVTNIGGNAFSSCTGLTSIIIPDSVTSIEYGAFSGCTGLTSIIIPDSVTSIEYSAFSGCTGLTSINVDSKNTQYHSVKNCLIETASKTLIAGCKNSVIPDDGSVTNIGSEAFYNCAGLTNITLPNNVTNIGNFAFSGCTGLTNITIPDGVTSIGDDAFYECAGLTNITIPKSVTNIGVSAFGGCTAITNINVDSQNSQYHSVDNCLIETASKTLIAGCKNSVIPDDGSVTSIGWSVFSGCTGLASITIPDSVTSIGDSAFLNCDGLTTITFKGTKEQWNAIQKGYDWDYDTGEYVIHCTDGDITK